MKCFPVGDELKKWIRKYHFLCFKYSGGVYGAFGEEFFDEDFYYVFTNESLLFKVRINSFTTEVSKSLGYWLPKFFNPESQFGEWDLQKTFTTLGYLYLLDEKLENLESYKGHFEFYTAFALIAGEDRNVSFEIKSRRPINGPGLEFELCEVRLIVCWEEADKTHSPLKHGDVYVVHIKYNELHYASVGKLLAPDADKWKEVVKACSSSDKK